MVDPEASENLDSKRYFLARNSKNSVIHQVLHQMMNEEVPVMPEIETIAPKKPTDMPEDAMKSENEVVIRDLAREVPENGAVVEGMIVDYRYWTVGQLPGVLEGPREVPPLVML